MKRGSYKDQNVGPTIRDLAWALAAISIVIVAMRFYVRAFIVRCMGWDDWTMLLALILGVINTAFVQISIDYGLGRHITTLDPIDAMNAIKWDYLAQPTAIMSPAVGRISFALLLLNVAGVNKFRRWFLYGIMISQFIVNSLTFIFILVQCKPIELLWDKRLTGTCWDLRVQEYFGYFQGSFNSVTDLILAICPALVVWTLNMKLSIRISLICLMGLGVFAMVGSIAKTILLKSVGSNNDYTYNTAFLIIWWTIELYLVIIAASIPTLRPLVPKRGDTSRGGYGNNAGSYGIKSISSRRPRPTDHFPLSSNIGDRHTGDVGSSQTNILEHSDMNEGKDIRKTVDVSVNTTDGQAL
ncbi:hypothetical protein K469DRAFT_573381 [Zopfia rhizophila CBS 207.26]|uniref:Rhodopsin domain-containing protein n=1 Tax=Zopfia rhizophila CBS 207.26 TaxID=1314779 RepID=A0A6A6E9B3_9PEZI|nr:hypothetical protein K469DRAFT_573381 [Zopfia rhizophila CBS 207.26]